MIRQLKVVHDTALKVRLQAIVTLKATLIHAPEHIRWEDARMTQIKLPRHLAAMRPRQLETPRDCIRDKLRLPSKRW